MKSFAVRLMEAMERTGTPVMVGIDPRWDSLPAEIRQQAINDHGRTLAAVAAAYRTFAFDVIDVVRELAPIVKFQAAFFEAAGPEGMQSLHGAMTRARAAGLLVVLDGKRNDIGSTAEAYAQAYLGEFAIDDRRERPWPADALTVNPFLGAEGIEPFLQEAERQGTGLFVLVRTSNKGAGKLQDLNVDGTLVHQRIADWVEEWSNATRRGERFGPVGAVVGATVPEQIVGLRERMPHVVLLLPGYGAQGGTARDIAAAFHSDGQGAVVNNSRGLIFAYQDKAYAGLAWKDAIRTATKKMIDDLAASTPAGKLRRLG